jgi:GlpG protein
MTFNFTFFFLSLVLLIQIVSFSTEILYNQSLTPQIANTAHMSGLLLGILLGNLNFFTWKNL